MTKLTRLGIIPVVAIAISIAIIVIFNIAEHVFNPPYLQFILQVFFVFGSSIAIAVISAREFDRIDLLSEDLKRQLKNYVNEKNEEKK